MDLQANKSGTYPIYQKPAHAIGRSASPTSPGGCVFDFPGLPGAGGKICDRSPYGNVGTIIGATWTRLPSGLWVLSFDGSDDYVDLGTSFQAIFRGSFSMECWIKPDDGIPAAKYTPMGTYTATGPNRVELIAPLTNGKLEFIYVSNGNTADAIGASASFSNGQETWHHIVGVADSTIGGVGGLLIYLDSDVVTLSGTYDGDTSGVTFADWTSAFELYIGAMNVDGTPNFFVNGPIALPRIYNRALTALEIQNHYQQEKHLFGVW